MAQFRKLLMIILTAFFVVIFVQNVGMLGMRLPLHFFTFEPLNLMAGYWFILFAGFGLFIGAMFSMKSYISHQKQVKALNAEIKHLNEELAQHRKLSLEGTSEETENTEA